MLRQRFQGKKTASTQWAPIRIEHPLMAKDTGLREEKCLGELPENGTEAHRDYNGSGRKSTKPPQTARKKGLRTEN